VRCFPVTHEGLRHLRDGSSALEKLNQEDDHRNDEEEMDEAADGVGRDQPYEPQYEQDDNDGPQHQGLLAPPSWGGVEVVVYAAESL